jgi:hypothetical protein
MHRQTYTDESPETHLSQAIRAQREAVPSRPFDHLPSPAQHVLHLQATAGNRAVTEQIQRWRSLPVQGVWLPAARAALGRTLATRIFSSSNPVARTVFKTMNAAMWVEGQPLTPAHQKVIEQSLLQEKNGILKTLVAENPHVMASKGYTPIYLAGKWLVHKPLQYFLGLPVDESKAPKPGEDANSDPEPARERRDPAKSPEE